MKKPKLYFFLLFFCLPFFLWAQSGNPLNFSGVKRTQGCVGKLGQPVVNVTFGAGSAIGPPVKAATTSYNYISKDCPEDGNYTILNASQNCFANWHALTHDHTGDAQGYFMLVNASHQPSDFYIDTVKNLCANSTYEFAAWIINMINTEAGSIKPNITFSIEDLNGTVLKSLNTGEINVNAIPEWKKYGFYFTTPPGLFDLVLRIRNNAPGGGGNDLAIDDITFRPVEPNLEIGISGTTGNTIVLCEKESRPIKLISTIESCYTVNQYQWQQSTDGGNSWTDIQGATAGSYTTPSPKVGTLLYRLIAAGEGNISMSTCRVVSSPITVIVNRDIAASVAITSTALSICSGNEVTFTATAVNGGSGAIYQWKINGVPAGANSSVFKTKDIKNGDVVSCVLISSLSCTNATESNKISMEVDKGQTLDLGRGIEKCTGDTVTLSAPGGFSSYQWSPASDGANFNAQTVTLFPKQTTTYTVTAQTSLGCQVTGTFTLKVNHPMPIFLGADTSFCSGDSIRLSPGTGFSAYNWSTGSTQSLIYVKNTGPYSVQVTDANGCKSSDTVIIQNEYRRPARFLPPDTLLCLNDKFEAKTLFLFKSYLWSTGERTEQIEIKKAGWYWLKVQDDNGCFGQDTLRVKEKDCRESVFVPNAFTPNRDGINDAFKPIVFGSPVKFRFSIYNRWGEKVFETHDVNKGWDGVYIGKQAPSTAFVWVCIYQFSGKPPQMQKGTLVMIK